jgi:signal transduction histidine kinase
MTPYQLIADGICRLVGFGLATVKIVDCDELVTVAVAHDETIRPLDPTRSGEVVGDRVPVERLWQALKSAEDQGRFKLARRLPEDSGGEPDDAPLDDPARWHPVDLLIAPIQAPSGELLGCLVADVPEDGLRPGPTKRQLLERYAEQATRVIVTAIERDRLAETARLATAARDVVRRATAHATLTGAIQEVGPTLRSAFGLVGLRLRVFDSDGGFVQQSSERPIALDPALGSISHAAAGRLWRRGQAGIVGLTQLRNADGPTENVAAVQAHLAANDLDSMLVIPLGAGEECLGSLAMLRESGAPPWTESEYAAGVDIGRDLGLVLRRARARERERQLIRDLAALDRYQSGLIATVAAQLQDPLGAIQDALDRAVNGPDGLDETATDGIHDGAQRMLRVADSLLLLSRLAHPDDTPVRRAVDLASVVRRVTDLTAVAAERRGLAIIARLPLQSVPTSGNPAELERLLIELLGNAVKYTPDGGTVVVRLHRAPEDVVLTIADTGLGIAEDEQTRVYDDFFRGRAAAEAGEPGSGLGLAIVDRIVRRHRGRIELDSAVGSGTTVRVTLPAYRP